MSLRILAAASLVGLCLASLAPRPCVATTIINGGNLVNQIWTAAGSPYVVQGDVAIPGGAFLRIDPGVDVRFASTDGQTAGLDVSRVELTVRSGGTLQINGTSAAPVTLMAQSGTSAGIWYGIVVESGAASTVLEHAVVEHAFAGLRHSPSSIVVQLTDVTFDVNTFDLVRIAGAADVAMSGTIEAGRFSGNLVVPFGATLALNRTTGVVQSGAFTLSWGGTYRPTLSSAASYQQLQVAGAVSPGGTLLLDVASLTASTGQSFTLLANDGTDAVSGQFYGMPEGTEFDAGNYRFQISYVGGTGNDVVVTVVPTGPTCDLSVVKSAPGEVPLSAGALDYTITVSNTGAGTAVGAVMVDSLPAGLRYSSAIPSQGSCVQSGGRVTCSLGDIAAAGSASIAIHTTFDFDTLVVVNRATASSQNLDTDAGNNIASSVTLVLPATTGVIGPTGAAPEGPPIRTRPNPSAGPTRVFFRAEPGSRAELEIFDAAGRRVRRDVTTVRAGDETEFEWDGRGDDGARVGAGVLYYRVKVNGRVIGSERSVLLR